MHEFASFDHQNSLRRDQQALKRNENESEQTDRRRRFYVSKEIAAASELAVAVQEAVRLPFAHFKFLKQQPPYLRTLTIIIKKIAGMKEKT